jgi:hypothetical protein
MWGFEYLWFQNVKMSKFNLAISMEWVAQYGSYVHGSNNNNLPFRRKKNLANSIDITLYGLYICMYSYCN